MEIEVRYSCAACGIHRRPVNVPERDPERIVTEWLERTVALAISRDHTRASPKCQATTMTELLIPAPKDADYIGQPIKN